jgi:hypothetical protein
LIEGVNRDALFLIETFHHATNKFPPHWSERMKLASTCLILLVLSCYALACSMPKNSEQSKPFPLGDYQYTGYGKNGDKIVEGRLSITSIESSRIKGVWQFKQIGNPEKIGPQVGTGELIGSIIEGKVYLNLNPNMADNNVRLKGTIENGRYQGTWSFDGEAGPMNQGTFEAVKKQ